MRTRRPLRPAASPALLAALALGALPSAASAQPPAPIPADTDSTPPRGARIARGTVRSADGRPVVGAQVFLAETLEGAATDSAGAFAFAASGPGTLVVDAAGHRQVRRAWAPDAGAPATVVLRRGAGYAAALAPIEVQAGRYTAGAERGATLTPLQVVTTPGAAADVNRAIQTLPGVQPVDEGTGLFVRGGDFNETRVFLNDGALLNPPQMLTPTGTFVGTVDPFQLDGIFFSSGGFGARYGNALSAVAGLRSQGRAERRQATLGAGLGGPSAALALPVGPRAGVRLGGNYFSLAPVVRLNGAPRRFSPAPHGHDLGGSVAWAYRPSGEVKVYALDTRTRVGVGLDEPSFRGTYAADVGSRFAVASWADTFGRLAPTASVAHGRLLRAEDFGAFRMRLAQTSTQLFASVAAQAAPALTLRGGVEVEHSTSGLDGTVPAARDDLAPGARRRVLGARVAGVRDGLFAEADWRAHPTLRLVAGGRTDRSTLAGARTLDPRLSAAWQPRADVTVTAAWGDYHQVPDALLYDAVLGDPGLPPMRARQAVAGLQVGAGARVARVEAYHKRYDRLAALTRDNLVRGGGAGSARGVDLFVRGTLPLGIERRTTYSFVRSVRTDPSTGLLAPAPFDVTHALTTVAERRFRGGWQAGVAWRQATGRPFTPAVGGRLDTARGTWAPVWGAPNAERFPEFRRLDLSLSRARPLGENRTLVTYLSVNNLLDRRNVQAWRYSADYAEREPVRCIFNRSVYFGATLSTR